MTIEEILREKPESFFPANLKSRLRIFMIMKKWKLGEIIILDVRSEEETAIVSINCGVNIPLNELPDRYQELPKDKLIAIFCPGKIRAGIAYVFLRMKGYENVKVLAATLDDIAALERP